MFVAAVASLAASQQHVARQNHLHAT